jgi:hypothetical protein
MYAIVFLVVSALLVRFFWIGQVNRRRKVRHRPKKRTVSGYYYKK